MQGCMQGTDVIALGVHSQPPKLALKALPTTCILHSATSYLLLQVGRVEKEEGDYEIRSCSYVQG